MSARCKEWHWEITTKCNLNCRHCLTECGKPRRNELSTEEAVRAVKIMADLGCENLMITGGEPLVYDGLISVLRECQKQGIRTQILTNGFIIGNSLAEQLTGFIEEAGVSLDGAKPETNDFIRGSHSFEKACRAIEILGRYVPVCVFFTVSNINIDETEKVINLSHSLGAVRVHISEIILGGRAFRAFYNRHLFTLSKEQRIWLKEYASESTGVRSPLEECTIGPSLLYMSSEGIVYPCTEVAFNFSSASLGDIKEHDFRKDVIRAASRLIANGKRKCCYQIYTGNNLVFCLNKGIPCPFTKKARCKND